MRFLESSWCRVGKEFWGSRISARSRLCSKRCSCVLFCIFCFFPRLLRHSRNRLLQFRVQQQPLSMFSPQRRIRPRRQRSPLRLILHRLICQMLLANRRRKPPLIQRSSNLSEFSALCRIFVPSVLAPLLRLQPSNSPSGSQRRTALTTLRLFS